jgi:hypothetical protein
MAFVSRAYASDSGFVALIRQSTQEAAASGGDGGTVDAPFHVLASGSRRRFGIHARGVRLSRVVGTAPDQFTRNSFLAFPSVAAYNAIAVGSQINVGAQAWVVSSKIPEQTV